MKRKLLTADSAAANATTTPATTQDGGFISEAEVIKRLTVCRKTFFNMRKAGKIPFIRLPGTRRNLYDWPSVRASLLRLQKGGAA